LDSVYRSLGDAAGSNTPPFLGRTKLQWLASDLLAVFMSWESRCCISCSLNFLVIAATPPGEA
jgi:hypothetical protein